MFYYILKLSLKIRGLFGSFFGKCKTFLSKLWGRVRHLLREDEGTLRRDAIVSLALYSLLLVWMLMFKFGREDLLIRNYGGFIELDILERFMLDLIPFRFTHDWVNQLIVIILNCFIFMPFGVVFNTVFKRKSVRRDLLICFIIALGIEVTQLFTMLGGFATLDIITNTLSYFVGLLFYRLVLLRLSVKWNVRIYRICNLIMLPLVAVAAVTTVSCSRVIVGILTRTL